MKPKRLPIISALFLVVFMLFSGALPAKAAASLFEPANFVLIRGGEFTMGSPENEVGRAEVKAFWQQAGIKYSETQHHVRLSDFSMSKYAVTVADFRRFVESTEYQTDAEKAGFSVIVSNGKAIKGEGVDWRCGVSGSARLQSEEDHPVLHVSWNDAVAYCTWLSANTGQYFRLPTEAEREYACRAGSKTAFHTGTNITIQQANFVNDQKQWRAGTVPVGSFAPNAWGLYNIHGNVYEWCSDWYGGTYYDDCKAKGTVLNPAGPATGLYRVIRGGSWNNLAENCRSANRNGSSPGSRSSDVSFRLVFVP